MSEAFRGPRHPIGAVTLAATLLGTAAWLVTQHAGLFPLVMLPSMILLTILYKVFEKPLGWRPLDLDQIDPPPI